MIQKLERIFYYPVLVIGTVSAFGLLWSDVSWLSFVAFACAALMWARPFLPKRADRAVRIAFWINFLGLVIATAWIAIWFFRSN